VEAKVLGRLSPEKVLVLSEAELVSNLVPLWGRKLGKETSREARSAEWVLAALSDFRGQIQARDLVRLIYEAAKKSQTDTYWTDRLLAPNVIRSVVSICSEQKIEEIGQENRKLKDIFLKLRSCQESQKRTPFAREGVDLTLDEIKTLEENGVILREGEKYHLSEVFRLGLGFKWEAGARPAVLSLSRKARQ
jgi:hypothetical protein